MVFVENDRRVHAVLKENVKRIGVAEDCLCWRNDMLRCSFRPKNVDDFVPFDLAFCDPPFAMIPRLVTSSPFYRSLERLAREDVTSDNALMLLRTPRQATFDMPASWSPEDKWTIQGMDVHLYRKQSDPIAIEESET